MGIARKSMTVTNSMWLQCNHVSREIIDKYLFDSIHLSKFTQEQYFSALRHYAYWLLLNKSNISLIEATGKDYRDYQNWLFRKGLSTDTVELKRSAISCVNDYIMFEYVDKYPYFRNYVTKAIKLLQTGPVHEKLPLTPDEYIYLCKELEKREDWRKLAWLKFTYISGCRRRESHQLLKNIVNTPKTSKTVKIKDSNGNQTECQMECYFTHKIICKGSNPRRLQIDDDVMTSLNKWLQVRGDDDCPYMFTSDQSGAVKRISVQTLNNWCHSTFAPIIGRRVHPHLLRESRATNLVLYQGKDIEAVRKHLGHKSSETTKIYIIRNDEDSADDIFLK